MEQWNYPDVRRDEGFSRSVGGGVNVPDPYHWLEDPDSEETKQFVDAQNLITMPHLEKCTLRENYNQRLTELWDFPRYGAPSRHGTKYYYYHNTGLQNQSVLYVQESLDSEPTVMIDPNTLSEDGTVALKTVSFSEDGKYLAYGVSHKGSDWFTVKFRNTDDKTDLPDTLDKVKFSSISWTKDGKGVFYNYYPEQEGESVGRATDSNVNQKCYYHYLGQQQAEDVKCAEFTDHPTWLLGVGVTEDGRYVMLTVRRGCDPVNRLYYCDLSTLSDGIKGPGLLPWVKLIDNFDAEYSYVANVGSVFTLKTNLNSKNYKLINIDVEKPEMENWSELVAEHENNVLDWVDWVNTDQLVLCYMQDVKHVLHLHDLRTGSYLSEFPIDIGTVSGFSSKWNDNEIFFSFVSFLTPGVIYRSVIEGSKVNTVTFREIKVANFTATDFEMKQVFYPSKDGTKIPMFLVHKRGLVLDGSNPVLLYGYGGFNISLTPSFGVTRVVWMQNLGGVYALANLRGGGEYGESWHQAGMLANKQNVFDDFHSAAEYLISENYTNSDKIVIQGGSNGGLLVCACANQRPELYKCVVSQVGVLDMLRFHKFTIGHAWITDFGDPEKPEDFEYIFKYSPLHNIGVSGGQYPAMLLLTADHDDRVSPLHSLKYIAQLQYTARETIADRQTNPLMIRVDTKAGHGAGKPTAMVIAEYTDICSFIAQALNLQWID